jgi:hypothetical protein
MTVIANTFETGLAPGTAITIPNSDDGGAGAPINFVDQGANGASITYDTAQAAHGTYSLKWLQGTPATGTPSVSWDFASSTIYYGRFYIRVPALPVGPIHIWYSWTGAAYGGFIDLNPTGALAVIDSTFTNKATTSAVVTVNHWYRIELRFVISTTVGLIQVKAFDYDSTSPLVDTTSTTGNFGAASTGPSHYINAVEAGFVYNLDDIQYNDSVWPGPVPTPDTRIYFPVHRSVF